MLYTLHNLNCHITESADSADPFLNDVAANAVNDVQLRIMNLTLQIGAVNIQKPEDRQLAKDLLTKIHNVEDDVDLTVDKLVNSPIPNKNAPGDDEQKEENTLQPDQSALTKLEKMNDTYTFIH